VRAERDDAGARRPRHRWVGDCVGGLGVCVDVREATAAFAGLEVAIDEVFGVLLSIGKDLVSLFLVDATRIEAGGHPFFCLGNEHDDNIDDRHALLGREVSDRAAALERITNLATFEAEDVGDCAGAARTVLTWTVLTLTATAVFRAGSAAGVVSSRAPAIPGARRVAPAAAPPRVEAAIRLAVSLVVFM
jgi:hypothetical protein